MNNDERILQACLYYARTHGPVHLLSEDTNLKVKATANQVSCSGVEEFMRRAVGAMPQFSAGKFPAPGPTKRKPLSIIQQSQRQSQRQLQPPLKPSAPVALTSFQ